MPRELVLQVHTLFGVLVFSIGLLQLLLKKGGKRHRVAGQVYLYSWLLILITGAWLGGLLITLIGIFGFYFAATGSRLGKLKTRPVGPLDKAIILLAVLVMFAVLFYSVKLFLAGNTSFGIIFAVFGLLFLLTLQKDIRKYLGYGPPVPSKFGKMDWYFEHLNRMSISFIAAFTAFASIQNLFGNNTLNFLMPTAIGITLIAVTVRRLSKKMIKSES